MHLPERAARLVRVAGTRELFGVILIHQQPAAQPHLHAIHDDGLDAVNAPARVERADARKVGVEL